MATCSANGTKGHHKFRLNVNETSTNITNNTSSISWSFVLSPVVSGYDWNYQSTIPVTYSITINGITYKGNIMSYNGTSTVTIKSGTQTITHNSDGTKNISFSFNVTDKVNKSYTPGNASSSGSMTLTPIIRSAIVTSGMDFNDESNPTIAFSNTANYQVAPYLNFYLNDVLIHSITREKGTYTSPYVWQLTANERTAIRTALSENVTCKVAEGVNTYNGNTLLGNTSVAKVFTIVNANPIFNNFTYADTNSATIALTGNNQKIIKNYSNVQAKVIKSSQAQAIKNTTMGNYKFVCGDNFVMFAYSTTPDYTSGTINKVTSPIFNVYAVDKRGNTTLVTKTASTFLEYSEIEKGTAKTERNNGTSEQTILTFSGKINKINFGNVTNSVKTAKYRYKTTDSNSWSNYTTITSYVTTDANGNFSFNRAIVGDTQSGFNAGNSYNIEIVVNDELSSITYTTNLGSALPNIALHKDGVAIMKPYDPNVGGKFQVDGKDVMAKITTLENQNKINDSTIIFDTSKRITITPTSGSAYLSYGNCYYYKKGTKIHIHIGIQGLTANTNMQIATMPAGYRPNSYTAGLGIGNTLTQKSAIQIDEDGKILVNSEGQYALIDFEYDAVQ